MAKSLGAQLTGRPGLACSVVVLIILSLAPVSLTRWVGALHNPVLTVIAPLQQTVRSVMVWFRPPLGVSDNPELEQLRAYAAELNAMYLRTKLEADDLRTRIREISRAMDLNPQLAVRTIMAPIIGAGADLSGGLVTVKAGAREGVEVGNVVAIRGIYLFGRVKRVSDRTSEVLPITYLPKKRDPEKLGAAIMLDEQRIGPRCDLAPTGDGLLSGKVQDDVDPNSPQQTTPVPGMLVRLIDDAWPASAKMLIIGQVDRIEPAPDQPLRKIVFVRPVYNIDRWSEVMIRIPENSTLTPSAAPAPAGSKKP